MMEPFTRLVALAAPLIEDNVDTDIILPARFLLHTEKRGLGQFAFYERRQTPGFILDQPRFADAKILIAGANFGCGSSREHAPWAIADLGIRAIIASSFGEIFANNCAKNGILTVTLADTGPLVATAEDALPLTIDLVARTIAAPGAAPITFAVEDNVREALLNGWDEVQTILDRHGAAIAAFEGAQRGAQPWLWSDG